MRHTISLIRSIAALTGLLLVGASAHAQERLEYAPSHPENIAITVRGGVSMATPRGDFPSIIVGDSRRGTGEIIQAYGESRMGSRIDLNGLIPIAGNLGVSLGIGSQSIAVAYGGDTLRMPTRFEVQTLQGTVGVQYSLLNEPTSYIHGGLRSIYVDGGLDIGLATLGNRVESTTYDDSVGTRPRAASGSFTSNEAFRNVVSLRAAVGLRFAPSPNFELVAEAGYSYALNPLFSSETITDNDFAVDVLTAMLGIGYRF